MLPIHKSTNRSINFIALYTAHTDTASYRVSMDESREYVIFDLQLRKHPGKVVYYATHMITKFIKRCGTFTGATWACVDHRIARDKVDKCGP